MKSDWAVLTTSDNFNSFLSSIVITVFLGFLWSLLSIPLLFWLYLIFILTKKWLKVILDARPYRTEVSRHLVWLLHLPDKETSWVLSSCVTLWISSEIIFVCAAYYPVLSAGAANSGSIEWRACLYLLTSTSENINSES